MKLVLIACGLLVLSGCEQVTLPPVPAHIKEVDAEDCAVMSAVLDGLVRPRQEASLRRGMLPTFGPVRATTYYLIDSTLSVCRPYEPLLPTLSGCIDQGWLTLAGRKLARHVDAQLGESLEIQCEFNEDVRYLSSHTGALDPALFRDEHRAATVIMFSAAIVVGRTAVIFYRRISSGGGVVWLEFVGESWQIRGEDGWQE